MALADLREVHLRTAAEWRRWLDRNHASAAGVWLVSYRRATGKPAIGYEDTVREALCYGWIDSTIRKLDEERTAQLFTPRRPGSTWALTNKARVKELIATGRMRPAGLAKIEAAKREGSWTLLDRVESLVVPPDLKTALAAAGRARAFAALAPSLRKQHLWSVISAKRPETRARRVASIVDGLR